MQPRSLPLCKTRNRPRKSIPVRIQELQCCELYFLYRSATSAQRSHGAYLCQNVEPSSVQIHSGAHTQGQESRGSGFETCLGVVTPGSALVAINTLVDLNKLAGHAEPGS